MLSIKDINSFATVNLIFIVSDFLRLFMSFKYGIILLRYYISDSVLFL